MSKVNPVSASASATSLEHIPKKSKRKASRLRLPTPPPDPTLEDGTKSRRSDEVLEYLESLQRGHPALSRSTSAFAPAIAAEDAFDHLDKLYKLMEQMLNLREQNVLLHRRIMDFERLRSMQDMNKQLDMAEKLEDVPDYDPDSMLAESFLYNILTETKKDSNKPRVSIPFGQSLLRKSQRSRNINIPTDDVSGSERRLSVPPSSLGDKPSKVSKWTKVKAAFKWEKASPTVSDAKSQDSGLGGMQPVNYELARYLRVPSASEELGTSPADSGAAEVSTPATLSCASSSEDIHRHVRRRTHEDTSDDEQLFTFEYIPISKDEPSTSTNVTKTTRTTWAKMKDIIHTQTRNSFKKKHRLSVKSDDFKIDGGSICSDEEVFEQDEPKSPILIVQSPEEVSKENEALSLEHSIPVDVIARYRVINEDSNLIDKYVSKWGKVKKAFLSSPSISRNDSSSPVSSYEFPAIKRDTHPTKESDERLHAEIQRNYLQLQKKLSQEFQEKLQEWERSKLSSPCASVSSSTQMNVPIDDGKDVAFKKKMEEWEKIKGQPRPHLQMQSEKNLPPEFKKKLQEWNKLKKSSMHDKKKLNERPRWKSMRAEATLDTQQLSEDFMKKYEIWKQIKSGAMEEPDYCGAIKGNKTPSPRLSRKEGTNRESKKIKDQTDKELQWFEKELGKIEREKQRLERDRQKFLDREERLSKLRRSLVGGNKKEVLVHTPSGFLRFEGISRKFTQKLYEWEKAQGIGPDNSTFALLKSSCDPGAPALTRSKSADSIMSPDVNMCPLLSQQPSSLSLNDVENLEKDILLETTSVPDIIKSSENVDSEEPEALIVEVEDVVEETASVLDNYLEKYFPVYQKQENSKMCEGETKAAPTIRRSESAKAQANYNLIEKIITLLKSLSENETDIEYIEFDKFKSDSIIIIHSENDNAVRTLKRKQECQKQLSSLLVEKLMMLQEANATLASNVSHEESQYSLARSEDVLDTIQDISTELYNLAETVDQSVYSRNKNQLESDVIMSSRQMYPQISESLVILNNKILELRRNLSYICAASDMAFSSWKKKITPLRKIPSVERRRANFRKSRSKDGSQESQRSRNNSESCEKNNSPRNEFSRQTEQGVIKKRIRYRQKGMYSKTLDESDDDDDFVYEQRKPCKPRRVRSQNSTESNKSAEMRREEEETEQQPNQPIIVDPEVVEKVVVPTKTTNFSSFEESNHIEPNESPVTVFIKTTRKLFTPIIIAADSHEKSSVPRLELPTSSPILQRSQSELKPPLPASPQPQRKLHKEISPNIRLMMVRYNQKICEDTPRSAGSSGSASPVAWRSPVLERRVKAQTERYQQELQKMSPLLGGRREIQKSASMGVVVSGKKQFTVHKTESPKGILKSSSAGILQPKKTEHSHTFTSIPETTISTTSISTLSDARSLKIQKAKEEFLNSPPPTSAQFLRNTEGIKYPVKNRLSQISVGSESSCNSSAYEGLLIKSASAGMINIDPDVYKQFDPEVHGSGYLSLPRSSKKHKDGLFSNITSKFRKVKMRRHKEAQKKEMNAVSTLCRQSLVVDIHTSQETLAEKLSIPSDSRGSSSIETSPSTSRTGSWIRRSKIFKPKQ